ncbi:copper chaperone PCu(A)C [Rhodalgimonas zhirmunskyi]|uniref:Copper chaperone PCu(A)C n=1 Tax=Rhodalgimonas zhirmunskyi TaxID=2964767 RepID=A0AAJ1X7P6_9RHOB|nr:copper chaperone PCu(A)C [Rhodoalgimonas zhirmunskyi]MDQ2094777.1 copper chaperone PCu(A)C [Rhodoalgimonas zhirmunskyi]
MSFKLRFAAATAVALMAAPVFADGISVEDPYARTSARMSTSGAAFMVIRNETGEADHLIDAKSDVAKLVELHTHEEDANGVMKMIHVEEGFDLPKDGEIVMARGGKHVMFMGLNRELKQGDIVPVTLVFEKAGEVKIEVPVDLERKPMHGKMDHSKMGHGEMKKDGGGKMKMSD